MRDPRAAPRAALLAALLAAQGCATRRAAHDVSHAPTPPTDTPRTTMTPSDAIPTLASRDALTQDVIARLRAFAAPREGVTGVLLIGGGGPGADAVHAALRAAFAGDPRVAIRAGAPRPGAPVADPSTGTGHVNTVESAVDGPFALVLSVTEWEGSVAASAHTNTHDPFGGPGPAGVLWVMTAPSR